MNEKNGFISTMITTGAIWVITNENEDIVSIRLNSSSHGIQVFTFEKEAEKAAKKNANYGIKKIDLYFFAVMWLFYFMRNEIKPIVMHNKERVVLAPEELSSLIKKELLRTAKPY